MNSVWTGGDGMNSVGMGGDGMNSVWTGEDEEEFVSPCSSLHQNTIIQLITGHMSFLPPIQCCQSM